MRLIIIIIFTLFTSGIQAQMFVEHIDYEHVISYKIYQINNYIEKVEPKLIGHKLYNRLSSEGYMVKEDSILVSFEISKLNENQTINRMNRNGANWNQVLSNDVYYAGYVQIDSLLRFPLKYPNSSIYIDLQTNEQLINNQGPTNINSISYETGTSNPDAGNGIIIAIIDTGTEGYFDALSQGLVPAISQYYNCSSGTCNISPLPGNTTGPCNGCDHGTNVAQIIFDHAPAATYLYYRGGGSPTPMGTAAAIEHAVNLGADIISCSLSGYLTGWNDNTGVLCSATNNANASDAIMFFSSGNRNGGGHWQGSFSDPNSNNIHEWNGGDETNSRTFSLANGASFNTRFQCNSAVDVYAVQFINDNTGNVLATFDNTLFLSYENCLWTNNTGSSVNLGVRVISKSSTQPQFEMHVHNAGSYEYASTSNQTSSPGNCTNNENVITVAAVPQLNYAQTNPAVNASSSVGPTNNGAPSVDITGPTLNTVTNFDAAGNPSNTTFGGTSCATPNCAGAVAAFWSKHSSLSADQVRQIVLSKAANYKDWGSSGYDNTFGSGGMFLYDYDAQNIYLHQGNGVNGSAPANDIYPWDNLKDIDNLAPIGRNVIMLTNDFISAPKLIDKEMIIQAPQNSNKRVD